MKNIVALSLLAFMALAGCKESSNTSTRQSNPPSMGEVGKMAMLVDDFTYTEAQGALDSVYEKRIEGMAGYEPYLKVVRCNENNFVKYFKHNYNLCVVYQEGQKNKLAPLFGDKVMALCKTKLDEGESFFVLRDVLSEPQEVTFILSKDVDDLKAKLRKNKEQLLAIALATERKTTRELVIRSTKKEDVFYNNMMTKYGYAIQTPANYKLSLRSDKFNGINRDFGDKQAGIYLYDEEYEGEAQFEKEYIIERRNAMLKKHLHGPDRPDSLPTYRYTDSLNVTVFTKETKVNGYRAIETRGWWQMANDFFGGPFVSYTIHCPNINKVVTVEGNVYAPSQKKQTLLREMELAISTFEEKK